MAAPVAQNRKARFDVSVEETFEAGIVLTGDEIKSIRADRLQLTGGYVKLMRASKNDLPQPVIIGLHLGVAKVPDRTRALLLKASEIRKIDEMLNAKGMTAVPLSVHFKRGFAKLLIGIGKGRKQHDKRQVLRERSMKRESEQVFKRS
jgi:SsrA-binding protein